jgi:hypothetical protein
MSDPASLTVAAIAVAVATKAFEKTGEILSENTLNLVGNFLNSLRKKDPATATAIEKVAQQRELVQQHPKNFGIDVLISKVEEAAKDDPDLQRDTKILAADAVQRQSNIIVNSGKIAKQVGVVIQGGNNNFGGAVFFR